MQTTEWICVAALSVLIGLILDLAFWRAGQTAEWISLTAFFVVIGLILDLAFRPLAAAGGPRVLLVLGTLIVIHPMWLVLWIIVAAYIGDATGWFRIEDSIRMPT
jgi:hypothetical protein